MCKIVSLVPSKKSVTRENCDKLSCLLFNFWMIKWTKTPILRNYQVPNGFFWFNCKFNHSKIQQFVMLSLKEKYIILIIQKLKSKHLICLIFLWRQVFLREREKISYTYSGPKAAWIWQEISAIIYHCIGMKINRLATFLTRISIGIVEEFYCRLSHWQNSDRKNQRVKR